MNFKMNQGTVILK